MLLIPGSQAYSNFRLDKLVRDLRKELPNLGGISSVFQHFVKLADGETLSEADHLVLEKLLSYGPSSAAEADDANANVLIAVLPRFGTISPWATKATDIAHHCGLKQIFRIERGIAFYIEGVDAAQKSELELIAKALHDPMTESVVYDLQGANQLFETSTPQALLEVPLLSQGAEALHAANSELGLALSDDEISYLVEQYKQLEKNPTDVELMMFAQVNSEHCRHKIFNADWVKRRALFCRPSKQAI